MFVTGLFLLILGYIVGDAAVTAKGMSGGFEPRAYNRWYVYLGAVLLSGLLIQPAFSSAMKRSVVEAFHILTDSMDPTLRAGDYLLVRKGHLGVTQRRMLERGQLVVFTRPDQDSPGYIKRIVGVPGDTLRMQEKVLYVNGERLDEPYVQHTDPYGDLYTPTMSWQKEYLVREVSAGEYRPTRDTWGPLVVPERRYFMLGDNRDDSEDSRYYGFVTDARVVGAPTRLYFSLDRTGGGVRWERIGREIL